MANEDFNEPFNIFYALGLFAALLLPTLPATLAWIQLLTQN